MLRADSFRLSALSLQFPPLDAIEQPCYSMAISAGNRSPTMDTLIRTLYRIVFTLAARLALEAFDDR